MNDITRERRRIRRAQREPIANLRREALDACQGSETWRNWIHMMLDRIIAATDAPKTKGKRT